MQSPDRPPNLSPEQYLEAERHAVVKHEYLDGEVYAMSGASSAHGILATNLIALLRPQLRGSNGRLFGSDMKVRIETRNRFYYPDLLVTCDPRDRKTNYYKQFPTLIVEILSDSTEAFDRGDKFSDYSELDSLQEYWLVSQKQPRVDRFIRQTNGQWLLSRHHPGKRLQFESLNLEIAIDDLYEDVDFSF